MTDPIIAAVQFLTSQLEYARHQPWADEFLSDIQASARVIAGIVNGPSEQRFLGPCGVTIVEDITEIGADGGEGTRTYRETECDGDIYARQGASVGRCRTCGAEVATDLRRAWLDDEVRAHAFRASEIAQAHRINVNTIRSWATRGLLASYWRTSAGLVTPWTDTDDEDQIKARGGRLHYVGDVLDLFASEAARRAGDQAKRARRRENAA